jgi:hypothetical protein
LGGGSGLGTAEVSGNDGEDFACLILDTGERRRLLGRRLVGTAGQGNAKQQ